MSQEFKKNIIFENVVLCEILKVDGLLESEKMTFQRPRFKVVLQCNLFYNKNNFKVVLCFFLIPGFKNSAKNIMHKCANFQPQKTTQTPCFWQNQTSFLGGLLFSVLLFLKHQSIKSFCTTVHGSRDTKRCPIPTQRTLGCFFLKILRHSSGITVQQHFLSFLT